MKAMVHEYINSNFNFEKEILRHKELHQKDIKKEETDTVITTSKKVKKTCSKKMASQTSSTILF